jgi:hypothetical protein
LAAGALLAAVLGPATASPAAISPANRIDMRVLVVDDGTPWVTDLTQEMQAEGVPYTDVALTSSTRPTITAGFLSSGSEAFYQGVILPNETGGSLSAAEMSALIGYESQFGIRQADAYTFANPNVGLYNWDHLPGYYGALDNMTATVTVAAQADGFGYLSGPIPFGVGSYGYLEPPMPVCAAGTTCPFGTAAPAGSTFTPLVTMPIPNSTAVGSVVGEYVNGGQDQLVVTAAMNFYQFQFRALSHGILSWLTHGVHFGYDRNYFTFHFDDAFNTNAVWDPAHDCTPGEDCPVDANGNSIYPVTQVRMAASDVTYAAQWEQQNNYKFTLAFNGDGADPSCTTTGCPAGADPLTAAFVANKNAFNWLNHGYGHIWQGCVQLGANGIPTPEGGVTGGWSCEKDASGNIVWVDEATIDSEISDNITVGQTLGLPFDPSEYLSGSHSGLVMLPQQPADNPNFAAALTGNGITATGADASREPTSRQVGSAMTVPRYPTVLYYNAPTPALEVSEYNFLYGPGASYCTNNPTVATCLTSNLDPSTGFQNYMVPTNGDYDLTFILANNPRPFYAHVPNLMGGANATAYPLLSYILNKYRASYAATASLITLSENQIAQMMLQQQLWSPSLTSATPAATGYIQGGQVHVTSNGSVAVPFTSPTGTTVNGATFGQAYGGERSGWTKFAAGTTSIVPPKGSVYNPSVTPAPTIGTATATGAGGATVTWTAPKAAAGSPVTGYIVTPWIGSAVQSATSFPASASSGAVTGLTAGKTYTFSVAALDAAGTSPQSAKSNAVIINGPPTFTSPSSATSTAGYPFSFTVTTGGYPAPTLTESGALPPGVAFTSSTNGTATLSGAAGSGSGSFAITLTAGNSFGTATQGFTLTVNPGPSNLLPDPGFETSAVPSDFVGSTLALSTAVVHSGKQSLAQTATAASGEWDNDADPGFYAPTSPTKTYTASIWVRSTAAVQVVLNVDYLTSAGSYIDSDSGPTVNLPANTWTQLTMSGLVPRTASADTVMEPSFSGAATGTVMYWDDMSLTSP